MVEFTGLDLEQKAKVLSGLDRVVESERLEVLAQALADPDASVQERAAGQVGQMQLTALYPFLLWAARERKDGLREIASQVLLAAPKETFRQVVSCELGSAIYSLRVFALELLARQGDLRDFKSLLPLLFDYKIDVRDKARQALKQIISRDLARYEEVQAEDPMAAPGGDRLPEDLRFAIRWLFQLADGPDRVTASSAAAILVDFGNLDPAAFWKGYLEMSMRGRESIVRVFLQREDRVVHKLLCLALLHESPRIRQKGNQFLARFLSRLGATPLLEVLGRFPEPVQARLARQLGQSEILRDLVARFEMIPERFRAVVFDLLEQVDCRPYQRFLEECLDRPEDVLVYRAVRLLVPLEHHRYVEQFKPLLSRDDPEILLILMEYYRKNSDVQIVPQLSPLLAHHDERVTHAAISTIFELSRRHLLGRYKDLSPVARREIVTLLGRLDESFVASLCEDIARLSSQEKIHLVNILEILGQESKIQETLLKLSKEPDQRVRATVAKAIRIFSEAKRKLELTRAFLEDEDTRVRANMIESLDNVDDPEILKHLTRLTRSPNGRERANAIKKLWEQGYRDFEISLVQMIGEPDEWTRSSAAWVLGEIDAPHLEDMLLEALRDSSPVVRENAIRALGKAGPVEQIRKMTEFLEDPDRRVREAARDVMRKRLHLAYEIE